MSRQAPRKRLVVLTACRNAQFAVRGILSRHQSLSIFPLGLDVVDYVTHPERDPGVLRTACDLLSPYAQTHEHALAIMDREGCGQETMDPRKLESQIEEALRRRGWDDRAAAVVIDPELDTWVWTDSPHVEDVLGWSGQQEGLREWLSKNGFSFGPDGKPSRPKEAMEAALRKAHVPRSSSLYEALAEKVSLTRCTDRAFQKLRAALQLWFPESGHIA